MITCFMFGRFPQEAYLDISPNRTHSAVMVLSEFEGEVKSMYALMGENDLVFIVDFPEINQALLASVALSKELGISFTTSPAITVEEFDAMMEEF